VSRTPFDGVVLADPVFRVESRRHSDHKIVSMQYAVDRNGTHPERRPDALAAAGLQPGRWLNALRTRSARGAPTTADRTRPFDRRPVAELRARS
jgi:hypothetical protein